MTQIIAVTTDLQKLVRITARWSMPTTKTAVTGMTPIIMTGVRTAIPKIMTIDPKTIASIITTAAVIELLRQNACPMP